MRDWFDIHETVPTWPNHHRKPIRAFSSTELKDATQHLIRSSSETSTNKGHQNAWSLWILFCNLHPTLVSNDLPDNALKVAQFATWITSQGYKPGTVDQYVAGIGAVYTELGYTNWTIIRLHPSLKKVLKGGQKEWNRNPANVLIKHKDVLTFSEFCRLLQTWDPTDCLHDNLLFQSILVFGFVALHRLAELVDSDIFEEAHRNRSHRILLSSIYYNNPTQPSFIEYFLPYHKADPLSKGTTGRIVSMTLWNNANPIPLLMAYFTSRIQLQNSPYLFVTSNNVIPTRKWFMSRLHQRTSTNLGSKSLRAGGATNWALQGKSAREIQNLGRWSTDTWKVYITKWTALQRALNQ